MQRARGRVREGMEGAAHGHPRMTVLTLALAAGVALSGCVDPRNRLLDPGALPDGGANPGRPGPRDPGRYVPGRGGDRRSGQLVDGRPLHGRGVPDGGRAPARWDVRPNALPGCSGEAACADRRGGQSVLLRRDGGREVGGPATPPGPPRFTDADALRGGRNTELRSLREAGSAVPRVSRRTRVEERGATSTFSATPTAPTRRRPHPVHYAGSLPLTFSVAPTAPTRWCARRSSRARSARRVRSSHPPASPSAGGTAKCGGSANRRRSRPPRASRSRRA